MSASTSTQASRVGDSRRVWLVTGTSSGLGKSLVEELLASGERVVATLRTPDTLSQLVERYPASQLLVLKLDVTSAEDIKGVFERTKQHFGRLDVVVNNAAIALDGEFEAVPEDVARQAMEVLFWGPANISREAIKFMREVNRPGQGGRILNISSMGGFVGYPTASFYVAGKFALEGLTECFAKEMLPEWNIKASIIEPGGLRTNSTGKVHIPVSPEYDTPTSPTAFFRKMSANFGVAGDPVKAARAIVRIADLEDPPLRIQLGTDSLMMVRGKALQTVGEGEKWADISHSTNADDVNKDDILKLFQH